MRNFYGRAGVEVRDTLSDGLESLSARVRMLARDAAMEGGHIIRVRAYENANVSAGVMGYGVHGEHMRDEIKVTLVDYPTSVSAKVGIDLSIIPYAPHQEFGPHGNAFMSRAVDETRQEVHQRMGEVMAEGLRGSLVARTAVRFRRFA